MLRDIREEQTDKELKTRKNRSLSKQRKHNTTPIPRISETPRERRRSPTKRRARSSKLTKDELKYQRFVNDLKKDIEYYLNRCLRESRFDPRSSQCSQINPSLITKRATSTIASYVEHETDTLITSASNRQDPLSFLTNNEKKRLTSDVQTILEGPALKMFYKQFLAPRQPQQRSSPLLRSRLLDESIVWANEEE